jgi:hypothetical protein
VATWTTWNLLPTWAQSWHNCLREELPLGVDIGSLSSDLTSSEVISQHKLAGVGRVARPEDK